VLEFLILTLGQVITLHRCKALVVLVHLMPPVIPARPELRAAAVLVVLEALEVCRHTMVSPVVVLVVKHIMNLLQVIMLRVLVVEVEAPVLTTCLVLENLFFLMTQ
jgi:hypothetical protein